MSYKPCHPGQIHLLPPSLDDLVPAKDLARIVCEFVDKLPRAAVEKQCPAEVFGRPLFHPRMMLKVILYAYSQKVLSCRRIAKAMRQDVCFMWLAGMERPDFNTVNRFRGEYLAGVLPRVFAELSAMLLEEGYIKHRDYFVDGSKFEADAGKNTYVWAKNAQRFKEGVQTRAAEIMSEADEINRRENEQYGPLDLPERGETSGITSATIASAARAVGEAMNEAPERARAALKPKKAALEKEAEKLDKYEEQERILDGRNSYSKTDPDATFMRMKNDELRAGYNVQAGTQNGFVTGITVGQNANDAAEFTAHMDAREEMGLPAPERIVGDAIYGTEANYAHCEENKIEPFLKYPAWYREQTGQCKPYEKAMFAYDAAGDFFTCPQGRRLDKIEEKETKHKSGYTSIEGVYACASCEGCPVKSDCTKSSGPRRIQHSRKLGEYQAQARANLSSEEGEKLRKRRGPEIETVWGHIKANLGYRRIRLRGLAKAQSEMYYLSMAHNLTRYRSARMTREEEARKGSKAPRAAA